MNLINRYQRLNIWNKLFVCGAVASIVGMVLFFIWPNSGAASKVHASNSSAAQVGAGVVVNNSPGAKVANAPNSSNVTQIIGDVKVEVNQKADYGRLREVANIDGVGVQWSRLGANFFSHAPSVIEADVSTITALWKSNGIDEGITKLSRVTKAMPEWPYAYYYLGLFTHKDAYFEEAVKRCADMREAGVKEGGILLCEACSLSMLGRFEQARERLADIGQDSLPIQMRLVVWTDSFPSDITERIKSLTPENWKKEMIQAVPQKLQ